MWCRQNYSTDNDPVGGEWSETWTRGTDSIVDNEDTKVEIVKY
jgi:hypothetical protein